MTAASSVPSGPGLWAFSSSPSFLLFFSSTLELEAEYIPPTTPLPSWQFSGELGHSLLGHP